MENTTQPNILETNSEIMENNINEQQNQESEDHFYDASSEHPEPLTDEQKAQSSLINGEKVIDLADLDKEIKNIQEYQPAPIIQDIELARKKKEQANEEFKNQQYEIAIDLYSQAIELCPLTEEQDLAIFHNNRGLAFTKINKNKEAKKDFTRAIEIKPDYVKPRGNRMKILKDEEEYDQALEDAKKIEELDPLYPNIHKTVIELDKLQKEKFEKMKTEVLGNLKSFGNMVLGKFGMSLDNFKLNQNPDGTYNVSYGQGNN